MPSVSRRQHVLMEIAAHTKGGYGGVPQKVGKDFAAADKAAGKFKPKEPRMAKHESAGMDGSKGVSPRKAMASGMTDAGSFGAEPYHEQHGGIGMHPDHMAGTGEDGAMEDGERGAPPAVHHTKGMMPAQAAPDHGPHSMGERAAGSHDHHHRDGKL